MDIKTEITLDLYHGCRTPLSGPVDPALGDSNTSLGVGFYCSDQVSIAKSHWRSGGGFYRVTVTGPTDGWLDLDQPLARQPQRVAWAMDALALAVGARYQGASAKELLDALQLAARDGRAAWVRAQAAAFAAAGSRVPEAHAVRAWLAGHGVWMASGTLGASEISGSNDQGTQFVILAASAVRGVEPVDPCLTQVPARDYHLQTDWPQPTF